MFIKMVLYVPSIPYCGPETGAVWDKKIGEITLKKA